MKIIVVGASGKIGKEVVELLSQNHDIVRVGAKSGDFQTDYTDTESIRKMYEDIGAFDALVSVVGRDSIFRPFMTLKDKDYQYGFERKFLGQVNLVRIGLDYINEKGVFVLTSGFLSNYANTSSIATGPLNAAIDTFVQNTSPLLPKEIRINVVSPAPIVDLAMRREGVVTAKETAAFYITAIESKISGKVLRAWGGLPVINE